MPGTGDLLKDIGEPIVRSALDEVMNADIPSATAREAILSFSEKWKDYSRAALMALSCEAVGGNPDIVLQAAKALVLSGGAFDLHDDIVDGSYLRTDRSTQTTLGKFGQNVTLLVGDALLIEGISQLCLLVKHMPLETVTGIVSVIKKGLYELGSAEVDELELVRKVDTTPEMYLRIVRMKAADVESYTRVGAMAGGGSAAEVDSLGRFGRMLGMAVILRDDIEDTFNDKRELLSRITKESLPLPIVYSLADPLCSQKIAELQATQDSSKLDSLLQIVERNQGFEKTKLKIEQLIDESKLALRNVKYPSKLLLLFDGEST